MEGPWHASDRKIHWVKEQLARTTQHLASLPKRSEIERVIRHELNYERVSGRPGRRWVVNVN